MPIPSAQSPDNSADPATHHETAKQMTLTALGTALLTTGLVGMHHCYRKQRQPKARIQDYVTGLQARLPAIRRARVQYAGKQAIQAWRQAYQEGVETSDERAELLATRHTTTVLARPVCWVSGVAQMPHVVIADDDSTAGVYRSGYGVVGIDAEHQLVWQTTMPERVHDIVVQPIAFCGNQTQMSGSQSCDVVVMGRRPSEGFWVLDTASGQVKYAITAATDRHFYGHACYSLDGKWLYVTENDTVSLVGKIGIYDAVQGYQKIAEFDSHGIGPHELIMHPDGQTLIVANGGIKTEQASREELNLDTMRPSLVYLDRHDGTLLEQVTPQHNQMSIRHLAIHDDGRVMIGIQFQGERHINVPLVLTHQRGDAEFHPLQMPKGEWQRFHQYIASVAVDSQANLLCVTTPIGGCAAIYDLTTNGFIDSVRLPDCAGAAILRTAKDKSSAAHFMVSDGQGKLTALSVSRSTPPRILTHSQPHHQRHRMSFDNHLQAL